MSTIFTSGSLRCRTYDIVKHTLTNSEDVDRYFIVPEGIKASIERMVMAIRRVEEGSEVSTLDGISVSSAMVRPESFPSVT